MSVEATRPRAQPGSLGLRTATGVVGLPLMLGAVWADGVWLLAAVAVLAGFGLWEFERLARLAGARPSPAIAAAGTAALILAAHLGRPGWVGPVLALAMIGAGAAQVAARWSGAGAGTGGRGAGEAADAGGGRGEGVLAGTGATVVAVIYVGYLFSHLVWLRRLPMGTAAPVLVLAGVWGADLLAYFVGLAWGRRRLAPEISPGKTVEGSLAGLVGGTAAALAAGTVLGIPLFAAGAVGLVCAVTSQVGDLWESALKRAAGVKDSGGILPGHGGVLDRFDGVLFAAPAGYYMLRMLGVP